MTSLFKTLYDSARRAFFGFFPNATDADWEKWCGHNSSEHMVTRGELLNLAAICHTGAADSTGKFDDEDTRHFCYSAGFFEALLWERFGEML